MNAFDTIMGLLRHACDRSSSDIHLSVGSQPAFRTNGSLTRLAGEPLRSEDTYEMAMALLTESQRRALDEDGEVDLAYAVEGSGRYRINVYRQQGRVSLSIRLIPQQVPTLETLRLPAAVTSFTQQPQGLVLVPGPTGSGKSSTLAAMIDYINRTQKKHIITLEDPVEFVHRSEMCIIEQREVGSDTRSFARGLRAALRQDPDVVLVGEMRDLETISAAVTAAETGHLVFATLHTSDAPQTVDRIIDAFPAHQQEQVRSQLAAVLVAVVSQRLLPRADGSGRTAALEIMVNTPAVANLIRTEKVYQIRSVIQTGRASGMQTMDMAVKELLRQGIVDHSVAQSYMTEGVN